MNSASVKMKKRASVKKFIFWTTIGVIFISTIISMVTMFIHAMGLIANLHGKYPGDIAITINKMLPGTSALYLYAFTILGITIIANVFDKLDNDSSKDEKKEASRLYNAR